MLSVPGKACTSSGIVGPHMLSRAVVVATIGSFSACAALARATTLCFSSPVELVADARHQADLVIDEDKRSVLGSQRLVRVDLIWHTIESTKATLWPLDR